MVCLHVGGCERSGVNAADLNGMVFILSDEYRSAVNLLDTDQPLMAGYWVKGPRTIGYNWTELGSGMKIERTKIDGAIYTEIVHNCDVGFSQTNGEYARIYQPCDTAADIKRWYPLETANLSGRWVTILNKPYEPEAHVVLRFEPGLTPPETLLGHLRLHRTWTRSRLDSRRHLRCVVSLSLRGTAPAGALNSDVESRCGAQSGRRAAVLADSAEPGELAWCRVVVNAKTALAFRSRFPGDAAQQLGRRDAQPARELDESVELRHAFGLLE